MNTTDPGETHYSLSIDGAMRALEEAGALDLPLNVLPPTPQPEPIGDFAGLATENGRLAWEFVDLWFNQKQWDEAFDTYVSRTDYFNHNPPPEVGQSFEEQKEFEGAIVPPATQFLFHQVIVQGELVVLHIEATTSPDLPIDQLVMILRIREGKVVDAWDLHVPLRSDSNMFKKMDRWLSER